jgi:hypothetical protein
METKETFIMKVLKAKETMRQLVADVAAFNELTDKLMMENKLYWQLLKEYKGEEFSENQNLDCK